MYLEVKVDKKKFIKTNKKLFKKKDFLTLFIKNNEGNICRGIINQDNSFYFGKVNKNNENRLLSKLELTNSNIEESYKDYLLTLEKFIEEWKNIEIINSGGV